MRVWRKPQWMVDQESTDRPSKGFAMIRNYGNKGPRFLKLTWRDPWKVRDEEAKDNIFRLKDPETGTEYFLDKEELQYWSRYV